MNSTANSSPPGVDGLPDADGPPAGIDQGAFGELLDRIRAREHPDYGSISWDGQSRAFTITVQFERNGFVEEDDLVRERALKYLGGLTPEEQAAADIEVILKNGVPVRAVLKGHTSELDPARLRELERRIGL